MENVPPPNQFQNQIRTEDKRRPLLGVVVLTVSRRGVTTKKVEDQLVVEDQRNEERERERRQYEETELQKRGEMEHERMEARRREQKWLGQERVERERLEIERIERIKQEEQLARERDQRERWEVEKRRLLSDYEQEARKRQALTSKETLERLTRKPYYSRENLTQLGTGGEPTEYRGKGIEPPEFTTKVERQVIERVDRTFGNTGGIFPSLNTAFHCCNALTFENSLTLEPQLTHYAIGLDRSPYEQANGAGAGGAFLSAAVTKHRSALDKAASLNGNANGNGTFAVTSSAIASAGGVPLYATPAQFNPYLVPASFLPAGAVSFAAQLPPRFG